MSPPPTLPKAELLYVVNFRIGERTYRVEVRNYSPNYPEDQRGVALFYTAFPPEIRFTHAVTAIRVFSEEGTFLWLITPGMRFFMSRDVVREPDWRWIGSLDGLHEGFCRCH